MEVIEQSFSVDLNNGDDENLDNGDDETPDTDTCSRSEMESLFNCPYTCANETKLGTKKTSILHLSGSRNLNPLIAAGLSDFSCSVYNVDKLTKMCDVCGHKAPLSGVKFSSQNGNLLYTGSLDGSLKLWDLRTDQKCVKHFKEDLESEKVKPITSFDITPDDRFICAGTELVAEDAFILFWDVRSSKLLGGYWESHTDDITQVKCHPHSSDKIATGSTDGLINIFDIRKSSEEEAFLYCLNTESSVEKISWFSHNSQDALSCITHTQDLQLWDIIEVAPYAQFSREAITAGMMRKNTEDCYVVDVFEKASHDKLILLCGSTADKGECLRTLNVRPKKLSPMSVFEGNKQIVRASWYNPDSECIVTGGEKGYLNIWKPSSDYSDSGRTKLKVDSKLKLGSHRVKQY